MRYELRRWTDEEHIDYVVRYASNDLESLTAQLDRVKTSSSEPNMNYIVDTVGEYDD